jgi:hypothetical protein
MADQWDAYIQGIQNGVPQPVAPKPKNFVEQLLGTLLGTAGNGKVGVGQAPTPNKQGLYTPSLAMANAGPPTPINYAAIKNLLNSGVMKTGQVAPMPPQPVQEAPPPPAAPAPKKGPLDMLFGALFGG